MAAKRNGNGTRKMGPVARRLARIERRTLRIALVPFIAVAQRKMMRGLERQA